MNIDLTKLKSHIVSSVEFDQDIQIPEELLKQSDLLALKQTHVTGMLYLDAIDAYTLKMKISGIMVLPCAVTLKPVDVPFDISVDDSLEHLYEEMDERLKNIENSIDILPIIWENILIEIPMRVVSDDLSDAKTSGDGWKIITEEEKSYVNPEFEKLKDLLK